MDGEYAKESGWRKGLTDFCITDSCSQTFKWTKSRFEDRYCFMFSSTFAKSISPCVLFDPMQGRCQQRYPAVRELKLVRGMHRDLFR
jgi:hypothetical protein